MAARSKSVASLATLACLAFAGCNDGRPTRVPVSGTVTLDGQPLTYGNVRFVPTSDRPSSGKLDERGRFTLQCYDGGDGAVVGPHRIQVSASEIIDGNKVVWHAPKAYSNFRSSGLTYEVTESVDDLVIELASKPDQARVARAQ